MKFILGIGIVLFFSACALLSPSNNSSGKNTKSILAVKLSKVEAKETCEAVGPVTGTHLGLKPDLRKALADLRKKAFDKGANYVRLDSSSQAGTTVQGMSFKCPDQI